MAGGRQRWCGNLTPPPRAVSLAFKNKVAFSLSNFFFFLTEAISFPLRFERLAMVLNPACKLESPGIFLKSQCPDQPPNQLYGSLWGWAGALVVLKAPQVILVSSQGWKPPAPALLCQLICESEVYKHVRPMGNSVTMHACGAFFTGRPWGEISRLFPIATPSPIFLPVRVLPEAYPSKRLSQISLLYFLQIPTESYRAADLIRDPWPASNLPCGWDVMWAVISVFSPVPIRCSTRR